MSSPDLRSVFLRSASSAVQDVVSADSLALDESLDSMVARARETWPTLQLSEAEFVARVAQVLPEQGVFEALEDLQAPDLYLATACARGEEEAVELCDRHYLVALDGPLARFQNALPLDEALQAIRYLLFLSKPGQVPKIGKYEGRGELGAWLRVVAIRTVISILRSKNKEVVVGDDVMAGMQDAKDDPELAALKGRYREEFRAAVEDAIGALEARERTLLRLQYLDGLNIDEIGAMYGVHRATAARWLAKIRETLRDRIRELLVQRLEISGSDVDSIARLVQSQLDLSIRKFLVTSAA